MEKITVKSTSSSSAECSDIILRVTGTTRLIFRPMLVENPTDADAGIKGTFLFQRKTPSSEWVDFETISLTTLKSGEGYKLKIKSAELLNLFEELGRLYKLHDEAGIFRGETTYIQATSLLTQISNLSESEISELLHANKAIGSSLFTKLLSWVIKLEEPSPLVDRLVELGPDVLRNLKVAVSLQNLKNSLKVWEDNAECSDEEFWQTSLKEHSFVLEQVFSWPISIVKGKAYVGGKSVFNADGNIIDFLVKNKMTRNAALIEIKTPVTSLLGSEYRSGVFNLSRELSGSVMQILNYKNSLQEEYLSLTRGQGDLFDSFDPQCAVIIGNSGKQLDCREKLRSFELFRHQLPGIVIITYDELFEKTAQLIKLLEAPQVEAVCIDDIPF